MSTTLPRCVQCETGEAVLVRSACIDDAPALIKYSKTVLCEDGFAVTEVDEFDLTEEQEQGWIKRHLDSPGSIVLVSEVNGTIVGLLEFECGTRRRLAHRGSLAITVLKECRGQGIGSILMKTLVDWAEAIPDVEKLCLSVLATNTRAIKLYQKFGFVEEGRRPREVKLGPDEYIDDVLMYRFVDESNGK